jgi:putative addiction module antidote
VVITGRVRRVGNSLVVTIPSDVVQRKGLAEGDTVMIEVTPATVTPVLNEEQQAALQRVLKEGHGILVALRDADERA